MVIFGLHLNGHHTVIIIIPLNLPHVMHMEDWQSFSVWINMSSFVATLDRSSDPNIYYSLFIFPKHPLRFHVKCLNTFSINNILYWIIKKNFVNDYSFLTSIYCILIAVTFLSQLLGTSAYIDEGFRVSSQVIYCSYSDFTRTISYQHTTWKYLCSKFNCIPH